MVMNKPTPCAIPTIEGMLFHSLEIVGGGGRKKKGKLKYGEA